MNPEEHILWVDLETTGVNPVIDSIIEVAVILTTPDLTELWSYGAVIRPTRKSLNNIHPDVEEMHRANGLWEALESPGVLNSIGEAEKDILDLIGSRDVVLAGSGVAHLDRPFIAANMPQLEDLFPYWDLDWGHVRRILMRMGVYTPVATPKTHRAMDDIRAHLAEARVITEMIVGSQT